VSDPYVGKHRGNPKGGYSRGIREKPGGSTSEQYRQVTLGKMPAEHIAGYHENMRRAAMHDDRSRMNLAKANHPSAGSRRVEFLSAHVEAGQLAEASRANAIPSVMSKTRGASFSGKKVNFDLARHAGYTGLN
jgi:hypothetical protein